MSYSKLDTYAFMFYCDAVLKNGTISNDLVDDIDEFIRIHNMNYDNLSFYYEKSKQKLRKEKLEKIIDISN